MTDPDQCNSGVANPRSASRIWPAGRLFVVSGAFSFNVQETIPKEHFNETNVLNGKFIALNYKKKWPGS